MQRILCSWFYYLFLWVTWICFCFILFYFPFEFFVSVSWYFCRLPTNIFICSFWSSVRVSCVILPSSLLLVGNYSWLYCSNKQENHIITNYCKILCLGGSSNVSQVDIIMNNWFVAMFGLHLFLKFALVFDRNKIEQVCSCNNWELWKG